MIDHGKIRQVIRARLLLIPQVQEKSVAWENRVFSPPSPVPDSIPVADRLKYLWLKETLIPVSTQTVASRIVMLQAYMQYSVLYPVGRGTEAPEQVAALILEKFRAPQTLTGQGQTVQIYKTDRSHGGEEGSRLGDKQVWYQIPTYIYFRSYDVGT